MVLINVKANRVLLRGHGAWKRKRFRVQRALCHSVLDNIQNFTLKWCIRYKKPKFDSRLILDTKLATIIARSLLQTVKEVVFSLTWSFSTNVEITDYNFASRVLYFIHLYLELLHWAIYVLLSDLTKIIGQLPFFQPRTTDTQWRHKSKIINWKIGPMWQTKYAPAVPKDFGLGLNFRPCSEGYFLSGCP